MPTVCEIKVELKKRGIKGTSGLNKAGLQRLLSTGVSPQKKPKQKTPSKPKKPPPPPLRLLNKDNDSTVQELAKKSYVSLKKVFDKIQRLAAKDSGATPDERSNAKKKLGGGVKSDVFDVVFLP